MPELPEVETTRRGIIPHVIERTIQDVVIRNPRLRWPVDIKACLLLKGRMIKDVRRRGKYLIFDTPGKNFLMHLGMSGSLRIVEPQVKPGKHDHLDIILSDGNALRFRDPRRFGAFLLMQGESHSLLDNLGPEPLSADFSADYLYTVSRNRKCNVKSLIMNSRIVVGVGNIYACESLYLSSIRPGRAAGRLTGTDCAKLTNAIKKILKDAIEKGGTSLRDFVREDGSPGYFKQSLKVYGRGGECCYQCRAVLKESRHSGRSTVYCSICQK